MSLMSGEDEVVRRLVEKTRQHLERRLGRLREALREAPRALEALEQSGLIHYARDVDSVASVVGLDGSRQVIRMGLGRYLVIAVTALVHLPGGMEARAARLYYPEAEVYEAYDPSGAGIDAAAEAGMLLLETISLDKVAETGAKMLMLDGPLIDPPGSVDPGVWRLLSGEILDRLGRGLDYHALRAEKLARLAESGVEAIGVVKRVSGFMLITRSAEELPPGLRGLSDEELLVVLSSIIRGKGAVIGPFTPRLPGGIASRYEERGARIVTYYTYSPWTMKPLRVEIMSESGRDDVEKAVETAGLIAALTPPGHSYPLPVQLAHEKSHLSRQLASLIYREALTSLLSSEDTVLIAPRLIEEA